MPMSFGTVQRNQGGDGGVSRTITLGILANFSAKHLASSRVRCADFGSPHQKKWARARPFASLTMNSPVVSTTVHGDGNPASIHAGSISAFYQLGQWAPRRLAGWVAAVRAPGSDNPDGRRRFNSSGATVQDKSGSLSASLAPFELV